MYSTVQDGSVIKATIVDTLEDDDNSLWITVSDCNLRHRYGRQLEDHGSIYLNDNWIEIKDVLKKEKGMCLFVRKDKKFCVGRNIFIRINEESRYKISQMHTSIHILCALTRFNLLNTYAGYEKSRIDFVGDFLEFNSLINSIRDEFKKIRHSSLPVKMIYATKSEIYRLGGVHEFIDQNIDLYRIIEIQDLDRRICMGTHVQNTNCIDNIFISEATPINKDSFKINLTFKRI